MRSNILKVLSGNTLAAGLSFLVSVALARMLSVEDFGEVSYAFTIAMMLAYLVGGGVGSFSVVTMPRAQNKALFAQQINSSLIKSAAILFLLIGVPVITSLALAKGMAAAMFAVAVVASAAGMLVVQQTFSLHQAKGNFGTYSKEQALVNLVRTLLVLGVAGVGFYANNILVVAVVAASATAFIIVAFILVFKYNNYWKLNGGAESFSPWKKDLKHMIVTASIIAIAARADHLIGKELLSPEAFGQYALASTLAMAFTLLQAAFMSVSLHAAAQGSNWEQVKAQQKTILPWLVGAAAVVVFTAQWIIPAVFGERYAGSVQIFQVLVLITLSGMLFTPVESFFSAKNAKAVTQVKLLQMFGAVGLGIGAAFLYGAVGMAVAVLASRWVGWAKLQYMGNRLCCAQPNA